LIFFCVENISGDAANTISPLLHEGCNGGLEDCLVLYQALQHSQNLSEATQTFHRWRMPEHISLARLSRWNGEENWFMQECMRAVQQCRIPCATPSDHLMLASFSTYSAVADRKRVERLTVHVLWAIMLLAFLGTAGFLSYWFSTADGL
jgi:2-polyprenyl-6-methoxyphenol hydroxylase-like FAD-dependent oxidoreductase